MSAPSRQRVEETLGRLLLFLQDLLPLANTHVADFLLDEAWTRLVPPAMHTQLLALSHDQLAKLPSGHLYDLSALGGDCIPENTLSDTHHGDTHQSHSHSEDGPQTADKDVSSPARTRWDRTRRPEWRHRELESFIVEAQSLTLPYLGVLTEVEDLVQTWGRTQTGKVFVGEFMSEKKKHEVDIMADVCAVIASHCQTDTVLDIGSGRGYLSSHLSLMHGLSVLAVDSSSVNTHSAQTRNQRLQKHWSGLVRNANSHNSSKGTNNKNTNKGNNNKNTNKGNNNKNTNKGNNNKNTNKGANNKQSNKGSNPGSQGTGTMDSGESTSANTDTSQKDDMTELDTHQEVSAERTPQPAETSRRVAGTSGDASSVDKPSEAAEDRRSSEVVSRSEDRTSSGAVSRSEDRTSSESVSRSEGRTAVSECAKAQCVQITQFITPETDLRALVRLHLPHREGASQEAPHHQGASREACGEVRDSVLLTGLHTCGNLASSMLHIFCSSGSSGSSGSGVSVGGGAGGSGAVAVCNVGCCYHHLDEAFLQGPFEAEGCPSHFGFPMSRFLTCRGVQLGRNARMLASQTPARMATTALVSHKSLYYRALLQVMLRDLTGEVSDDWHVGKIYAKSHDFTDYAQRALKKLHIDDGGKWTRDFVEGYEARFAADQARLTAFVQLRAALAPVIETFILLDRLLYLLEQEVVLEAHLVQLFDPVTSPRCYGLIATRR